MDRKAQAEDEAEGGESEESGSDENEDEAGWTGTVARCLISVTGHKLRVPAFL